MVTCVIPSRHGAGWAASHADTTAADRPSTWARSPPVPAASTNPVCHRSRASTHLPVPTSWVQTGLPRRFSSTPRTLTTGSGAASGAATWSMNAPGTVAHPTPSCAAVSATHRCPVATASQSSARNRTVNRVRAGADRTCSVNEPRGHRRSTHRHRRLRQTRRTRWGPYGISQGLAVTRPFTEIESSPHDAHADAARSAVTTCTPRPRTRH